ncbi:MAG: hypothetical protein KDE31_26655, partial [Caldilineaceae bacterium]|nr:hypothetical protein [Caldilineaceae bacterium]
DDVDDLRARAYLRESIVLLQTLGDPDALCFALHLQGEMALVAGEFAVADETLQQMLMMANTNVLRRQQAMALTALAKSNVKQGRWASASAYGEEGLQIALAIGDKDRMMAGHCYLGHVRRAADNRPEALLHYGTAFALALALENHHFAAEALQGCGAIALAHGANTVAVQLWSAATRLLDVTPPHIKDKDRSFLFEPLARLKAQMPPADYAAAWMIGERWSSDEMAGAVQCLCRSQWA